MRVAIEKAKKRAAEKGRNYEVAEINKNQLPLIGIHGRKYTVGRLEKGYFWEAGDKVRHTIGIEKISPEQTNDIIQEIQNITFPYAEHVKAKKK